jgi:hypothetical protein
MKLEQRELDVIRSAKDRFTELKLTLGDLELNKQAIIDEIKSMRESFKVTEASLIEKYGSDVTINMSNGEITKKDPQQPTRKV